MTCGPQSHKGKHALAGQRHGEIDIKSLLRGAALALTCKPKSVQCHFRIAGEWTTPDAARITVCRMRSHDHASNWAKHPPAGQASLWSDMVRIRGGTFWMGSNRQLPGRSPGASGLSCAVLDRQHAGHQQAVPAIRRSGQYHSRRDRARSKGLSRCVATYVEAGLAGVHTASTPR
jgi:hypothetical protein